MKFFLHISIFSALFFLMSRGVIAAEYPNPLGDVNTIPDFLAKVLEALSLILLPLIVIFVIYAGYLFVTAQGEEGKIQKARTALLWTLIGAGVILGAQIMANILRDTLSELNT
jgi:cytochrome c biogenesis protein CcdA